MTAWRPTDKLTAQEELGGGIVENRDSEPANLEHLDQKESVKRYGKERGCITKTSLD